MAPITPWQTGKYPNSRRSDRVDIYQSKAEGEVKVADPYQWLEENSKETEQWVDGQSYPMPTRMAFMMDIESGA